MGREGWEGGRAGFNARTHGRGNEKIDTDAVAVVDAEVVAVDDAVVVRVDVADAEADDVAVVVCVDTSQRWNSSFATWLTNSLTTEAYISQLFATTNAPYLHAGVL